MQQCQPLHDTVEDTDYTLTELEEDFGRAVADIVASLSEPQDDEYKAYSWKEQKMAYAKLLKKASAEALLICAADKIHNMRAMVEEYHDDHQRFLSEFKGSLDDRVMMYQEISNVLNSKLENDIMSEFNHVFDEYKNFILDVQKTKDRGEKIN